MCLTNQISDFVPESSDLCANQFTVAGFPSDKEVGIDLRCRLNICRDKMKYEEKVG
jgi:hypothetical protein